MLLSHPSSFKFLHDFNVAVALRVSVAFKIVSVVPCNS